MPRRREGKKKIIFLSYTTEKNTRKKLRAHLNGKKSSDDVSSGVLHIPSLSLLSNRRIIFHNGMPPSREEGIGCHSFDDLKRGKVIPKDGNRSVI